MTTGQINIDVKIRCRCGKWLKVNAQDSGPHYNNEIKSEITFFVEWHNCKIKSDTEKEQAK